MPLKVVRQLASTAPHCLHVIAAIKGDHEFFGETSFASSIEYEKTKRMRKCLAIFNLWAWLYGAVPCSLRRMHSHLWKKARFGRGTASISSKLSAIRQLNIHHQCLMGTYPHWSCEESLY